MVHSLAEVAMTAEHPGSASHSYPVCVGEPKFGAGGLPVDSAWQIRMTHIAMPCPLRAYRDDDEALH